MGYCNYNSNNNNNNSNNMEQSMAAEISLKVMAEVEELADEILTDKAQIVDCDKKRNANREALRALKKNADNDKEWFCIGNLFVKLSHSAAVDIIENDQIALNEQSKKL